MDYLKDPTDIPLPPEYGAPEDVCEQHGQWKIECKECFEEQHVDVIIDAIIEERINELKRK